jgi:hypothetical protein
MENMKNIEAAKLVAERTNYLNKDILYLKNTVITEYDIKSAGFTVIKFRKLLPQEEILELEGVSKEERNIRIGKKILQYPKIGEEIINTLAEVRKKFIILNSILDYEILSIKKDAVFLIKKKPIVLLIDNMFEFREKKSYTSYCYINQKEFYYSAKDDSMDIKGIAEESKELQKEYLLKDIKKTISMSEKIPSDQLFSILKQYRSKYLNRKLNKEVYRDVSDGKFLMNGYFLDSISEEELKDVDITQNYINYLIPLFKLFV